MPKWDELWLDAHLATMKGSSSGAANEPYGTISDGAIATLGDRIAWVLSLIHI